MPDPDDNIIPLYPYPITPEVATNLHSALRKLQAQRERIAASTELEEARKAKILKEIDRVMRDTKELLDPKR